jgi:hypothetical protein
MTATTNFPETFTRKNIECQSIGRVCIINGTSHVIPLYRKEDVKYDGRKNILYDGATPICTIEKGTALNLRYETEESEVLGMPLTTRKFVSADIPNSFTGIDIVICSAQYAIAMTAIKHNTEAHDTLFLGIDTVYNSEGAVVGAVGFIAQ